MQRKAHTNTHSDYGESPTFIDHLKDYKAGKVNRPLLVYLTLVLSSIALSPSTHGLAPYIYSPLP